MATEYTSYGKHSNQQTSNSGRKTPQGFYTSYQNWNSYQHHNEVSTMAIITSIQYSDTSSSPKQATINSTVD